VAEGRRESLLHEQQAALELQWLGSKGSSWMEKWDKIGQLGI